MGDDIVFIEKNLGQLDMKKKNNNNDGNIRATRQPKSEVK